jgi:hypothetical protein
MRDVLVYIAGPISQGDLRANVRQACDAGVRLLKAGIAVHVPHLTCYMGQVYEGAGAIPEVLPRGTVIEDWYGMSLVEARRCDAVLRLPGPSRGADLEVEEFCRLGRPVFATVEEVIAWVRSLNQDDRAGCRCDQKETMATAAA